jgi:hypothetical protein
MARKPVPLNQQIEELEREIADRKRRLAVVAGGRGRSVDEYRLQRLATLRWIQAHDKGIKAAAVRQGDLPFKVERWNADDSHIEGVIAAADNVIVARAAFEAAVKAHPAARITLRDGIRVIEQHPRE